MRWNMVHQFITRVFGLGGPSCRELRAEIVEKAKTIEVKQESILVKRAERKRSGTTIEINPPVTNGSHS